MELHLFQDLCNWQRIPEFEKFISIQILVDCIQANAIEHQDFFMTLLVKEPGSSIVTPWHQDQSYYCTSGKQTISF